MLGRKDVALVRADLHQQLVRPLLSLDQLLLALDELFQQTGVETAARVGLLRQATLVSREVL